MRGPWLSYDSYTVCSSLIGVGLTKSSYTKGQSDMRVTVGSAFRLQLMLLFRQYFRLVLPQTALQELLVPSADTVCIAIYAGNLDYWESLGIQKFTHSHTNMSNMGGLTALLQKHSICRDSWASTFVFGNTPTHAQHIRIYLPPILSLQPLERGPCLFGGRLTLNLIP